MKYIKVMLVLVAFMATSSIVWLGFTDGHEALFRLCMSIAVFTSLCFIYIEEKKGKKRTTLFFLGLSLISIAVGIVQIVGKG
ncbi:hypothetical protein [Bacillus sp. RAR_GA_16]|uniref:hypothetical protein n=1 Tax=Bacillus sp. RAR_GA_16 TaxID=2876774 RepID=UPI001CD000F2|nr:hypothetical protein [Bacillus sp. RAR_GA_16]MCA0173879.1 hypothetical protein [Bacillus sp. RAR_GA_16]